MLPIKIKIVLASTLDFGVESEERKGSTFTVQLPLGRI